MSPASHERGVRLVAKAERYATAHHAGQLYDQRAGIDLPYTFHLSHAIDVAFRFRVTHDTLVAAVWLHDVLEDTDAEYLDLVDTFGYEVARLVDAVTDMQGANRKERQRRTYPRIRNCTGATVVKLCDRIANVEHSATWGSPQLGMYRREHLAFRDALHREGQFEEMWTYLDQLIKGVQRLPVRQDWR